MTYGQALGMPDGPGWWAYDGESKGIVGFDEFHYNPEEDTVLLRWYGDSVFVKREASFLRAWGKFYRVYMPWEQPPMPQADWDDAPEWAMWWAVDANQSAYWYKTKPEISFGTWEISGGAWDRLDREVDLPLGMDWRLTLQRRPQEGE